MAIAGGFLRILTTLLYVLAFCCSVIILGIYSYFLATLSTRDVSIPTYAKAVEGIAGAGVLYTIFALILTVCLGGKAFFAFIGILLDVLFVGGFVAIAVLTRHGLSCGGDVRTPLGDGPGDSRIGRGGATFAARLHTTCMLNKACFAVAVIGAFLFLFAALFQVFLARHTKKEKAFGPGPKNNYTTKKRGLSLFKRKNKTTERDVHHSAVKDAEAGVVGHNGHSHHHSNGAVGAEPYASRYETPATTHHTNGVTGVPTHHATATGVPTAGGYHSGPQGTAVNPYGYETKPATAAY